jgi:hypothetical protein
MIVTGQPGVAACEHAGYVAGRYRDGALSDTWTDVARCARGTFVGYVPACSCGWFGAIRPNTVDGFRASQHALRSEHLSQLRPAAVSGRGPSRSGPIAWGAMQVAGSVGGPIRP